MVKVIYDNKDVKMLKNMQLGEIGVLASFSDGHYNGSVVQRTNHGLIKIGSKESWSIYVESLPDSYTYRKLEPGTLLEIVAPN